MNYLDRNNIAAARLKGLQTDLNLTNTQYSTCLSILYVGYILMQVPSNIFINRIKRPSIYLGCIMTLWGLISTLSGIAKNFADMVVIRFFLGFVEAAFLPGALMILSKWCVRIACIQSSNGFIPQFLISTFQCLKCFSVHVLSVVLTDVKVHEKRADHSKCHPLLW